MKIIPRGKYILVQRDEAPSRVSEHGIAAPSSEEQEEKAYGTVAAVVVMIANVVSGPGLETPVRR